MLIQQAPSSLKFVSSRESTALRLSALISKQSRDTTDQILPASVSHPACNSWEHWGSHLSVTFPREREKKKKSSNRSGTRTHWKSGFWSHTKLGSMLPSSPSSCVSLDRFLNFSEAICNCQKQCQPHRIMTTEWTNLFQTLSTLPDTM